MLLHRSDAEGVRPMTSDQEPTESRPRPVGESAGTFSQLFARNRVRLVRFARALLGRGREADAEDCVHDALIEYSKRERDYASESHFVRLFRRFVHNSWRGRRRHDRAAKRGGEQAIVPLPSTAGAGPSVDQDGPRTAAMRGELHAAILSHLSRLKPEYQRVIELRLVHGMAWRQVAEQLSLATEDAARKKYAYAIDLLRTNARDLVTNDGASCPDSGGRPGSAQSELDDAG